MNRIFRRFLSGWGRASWRQERAALVPERIAAAQQRLLGIDTVRSIIDAGANRGDTIAEYRQAFPLAEIVGFEPTPDLAAHLRDRFGADPAIRIEELALGKETGRCRFHLYDANPVNSLLELSSPEFTDAPVQGCGEIDVTVTTLDEYCLGHGIDRIDVLKLDLQGGDLLALQGARALLESRRVRSLVVELLFVPLYRGGSYAWDICAFLDRAGYRLFDLYQSRYAPNGQLKWCDGLFLTSPER